jgi:hypothetical protein
LSADDILGAAIFFGSIIVREAAAQMKVTTCRGESSPRLFLAASCAAAQAFVGTSHDPENGRDDSTKAFAARQSPSVK